MGEYESLYDTISNILSSIKEGLQRHDYALIPYIAYENWKGMSTFKSESEFYVVSNGGEKRRCLTAEFEEDGKHWIVTLGDSKHPEFGARCLYIQNIMLNDEDFASPKITVDDYEKMTFKMN